MSKTGFLKLSKLFPGKTFNLTRLCYSTTSKPCWSPNIDKADTKLNQNLNYKEENQELEETQEVLDVYKERLKYSPLLDEQEIKEQNQFSGLNLEHGLFGVFDIEDLVETLRHQNSEDIFVASVPIEIKYVDYIVVVSGRSRRHMQAIAQFVRRVFKQKRYSSDIVPKLEGENSQDWMALDLGNIALHIFSRKARVFYDLDSLWAVGPKYDKECNKIEPVTNMLEKHATSLDGLEPAS